jgi:hypothetical protein
MSILTILYNLVCGLCVPRLPDVNIGKNFFEYWLSLKFSEFTEVVTSISQRTQIFNML